MTYINIKSHRRDLIELAEPWTKNKLSKLSKSDQKLIKSAYKALNEPKTRTLFEEKDYRALLETLEKLPPDSGKKSYNIFRKILSPFSLESQTYNYMKKAEKTYHKDEAKKFYSGLNKSGREVVNGFFKANKIEPQEQQKLMELTNSLTPDRTVGNASHLIDLLRFVMSNKDNETTMEYAKLLLYDDSKSPKEALSEIENEKPKFVRALVKFYKNNEEIVGKEPPQQSAFLPTAKDFITRTLNDPNKSSEIANLTKVLAKVNPTIGKSLLERVEQLHEKIPQDSWTDVISFMEKNCKHENQGSELLGLLETLNKAENPMQIIDLIDSLEKPLSFTELLVMAKALSKIPEDSRMTHVGFAIVIAKEVDKNLLGTITSRLIPFPTEPLGLLLEEFNSQERKIPFRYLTTTNPDLKGVKKAIDYEIETLRNRRFTDFGEI